ncbi:DeoR/GlpR family DNA-binding transcription regulator [Xylocopilactobacillus apicola]|uniref:DeoR family transcriptional regulator n=1 Tax=Xylocopilactobacillus apicola TaxID=2932184 RepID=A0AAU9DK77_9LACO|nr:DeoR/GlpR family DNA-binding transcription regulator [Xylocopilactobacillus apicola]BDR58936.1 DeoR family transcriptional regulator [Xylocopilactobacillus apicola]
MLRAERHRKILSFLEENNFLDTQAATKLLDSSLATVRRDFSYLEAKGEITRIHGGAKLIEKDQIEFSFSEKLNRSMTAKRKIAKKAASLVPDRVCLYLDAGTTTLQMVDLLPKNVKIVTNSVNIAHQALTQDLRTILIGGEIKKSTDAMIGPITLNQLKQFHFGLSFIGINGVCDQFGYTTPDPEEAIVKQQALIQSDQSYFLADQSKMEQKFLAKVADLKDYPLITEKIKKEQQ